MNISGINQSQPVASSQKMPEASNHSEIRALEQKLQTLNTENQQEERSAEKMPGDPSNGRYIDERI